MTERAISFLDSPCSGRYVDRILSRPSKSTVNIDTEKKQLSVVIDYHNETKHDFHRFARSRGYLDWATQPHPFRYYEDARRVALTFDLPRTSFAYDDLYTAPQGNGDPINPVTISDFLRYSMALSAWKEYQGSRWALRINPSSGNLHPTECYLVIGSESGLVDRPSVLHYVSERHLLEERGLISKAGWSYLRKQLPDDSFLVGLTSIPWRESWKYGERAFRYCQHDAGHAIAALAFAGRMHGWHVSQLASWSDDAVAALLGLDRVNDFVEQETEEPDCLLLVSTTDPANPDFPQPNEDVIRSFREGEWSGQANRLSGDHDLWQAIDIVTEATRKPETETKTDLEKDISHETGEGSANRNSDARAIIHSRRSALALDGESTLAADRFFRICRMVLPGCNPPWTALWWPAAVHLAIFVHRVDGLSPGLYLLVRRRESLPLIQESITAEFAWEKRASVPDDVPLYLLSEGDARGIAERLSCDQVIAADGYFSLGMLAEFRPSLETYRPWFYRNLFWESGVIGQVLYLEAEAAGGRGTGIGCFYDEPVHRLLGIADNTLQSLYHFTIGMPVEDTRLTTHPPYHEEQRENRETP